MEKAGFEVNYKEKKTQGEKKEIFRGKERNQKDSLD